MYDGFAIPCECGRGNKLYLQAGPDAQNPGRFYYRCPFNRKRECSFIWADELLEQRWKKFHPFLYTNDRSHWTREQCNSSVNRDTTEGSTNPLNSSVNKKTDICGSCGSTLSSFSHNYPNQESPTNTQPRSFIPVDVARRDWHALLYCCIGCIAFAFSVILVLVAIVVALFK